MQQELKMKNDQKSSKDFPRIYTLHSQKGGVGKTSIAIAIAGLAALHNDKKTLIIDADFTGTSFLDITDMIKNNLKSTFNDLILANPTNFAAYTPITHKNPKIEKFEKKFCKEISAGNSKIFCMPGSTFIEDMQKIIPLISQEDHLNFFRQRMEDILVTATMAGFEVIIIDHSPGLLGLSKASLSMVIDQALSHIHDERHPFGPTRLDRLYRATGRKKDNNQHISAYAVFVTTADPVDYKALFPTISFFLDKKNIFNDKEEKLQVFLEYLDMIVNKMPDILDPLLKVAKIFEEIKKLSTKRDVHQKLIEYFDKREQEIGAVHVARLIQNFDMSSILDVLKNIQKSKNEKYEGWNNWQEWCVNISKKVQLPVKGS